MTQRLETPTLTRPALTSERARAAANGFWLGVAAIAVAAAAFLVHQLMAWPPHEDETLALFVGRDSLAGVIEHVTRERGGAPLHFLFAFGVAHLGLGLGSLRLVSAAFAVASLPLIALLGRRLADRRTALIATALAAASWVFLFHGVYARMYSLFLFLSLLAFVLLLRALDGNGWRSWGLWGGAMLLAVASHPYGALVLAAQATFVLIARRDRLRPAVIAFTAVVLLGTPFWLTDLVLAGRFDVGVGGHGAKLGGPWAIVTYLWQTAGDFSSGRWPVLVLVLAFALVGLVAVRAETRVLALCAVGVPVAAFLAARLGGSTSPESRHLIFVLPFFAILVGAGIVRMHGASDRRRQCSSQLSSSSSRSAGRGTGHRRSSSGSRTSARRRARQAERFLAATSRRNDLLFAYDPLYLGAWERNRDFPDRSHPSRRFGARASHASRSAQAARPRSLGPRRERTEQRPSPPRDRESQSRPGGHVRDACVRPVPRDPHPRARADRGRPT